MLARRGKAVSMSGQSWLMRVPGACCTQSQDASTLVWDELHSQTTSAHDPPNTLGSHFAAPLAVLMLHGHVSVHVRMQQRTGNGSFGESVGSHVECQARIDTARRACPAAL